MSSCYGQWIYRGAGATGPAVGQDAQQLRHSLPRVRVPHTLMRTGTRGRAQDAASSLICGSRQGKTAQRIGTLNTVDQFWFFMSWSSQSNAANEPP